MKSLFDSGLGTGTKATYTHGVSAFSNFLLATRLMHVSKISHNLLLQFIAYLVSDRKLAYNTICVYINAVRDWLVSSGRRDPLDVSGTKLRIYKKFMQGVRRQTKSRRHYRHPFKKREMRLLLTTLPMCGFTKEMRVLLKAVLLTAYFGCLRVSEYSRTNTNSDTFLRTRDVKFIRDRRGKLSRVKLRLRRTKTTQFGSNTFVDLFPSNDIEYCPVEALYQYSNLCRIIVDKNQAFFCSASQPLTDSKFNRLLRTVIKCAGLDPARYSSHSLRAGGATVAADNGTPSWVVQRLGRWKSECYKIYIRSTKNSINIAQGKMSL